MELGQACQAVECQLGLLHTDKSSDVRSDQQPLHYLTIRSLPSGSGQRIALQLIKTHKFRRHIKIISINIK